MTNPQNLPISEIPVSYTSGLLLTKASSTTLSAALGRARDSQNQMDMITTAATTINFGSTGLNALDTGAIAASTWYAIYMIADVQNRNATGFVASTSATAPTMPFGYSNYRRIGWAKTDGSSHILAFYQTGAGSVRSYQWDVSISVLAAGTSATFAAISLAAAMPLQVSPVILNASFTPNTAADTAQMRPTGSTEATLTPIVLSSVVASKAQYFSSLMIIPQLSSSNPSLDYIVATSGSLSVWVSGYVDYV